MDNNSTIITFANQKGGVGKSALCSLFGNYLLSEKGVNVRVVDGDAQKSIIKKRDFARNNSGRNIDTQYYPISLLDLSQGAEFKASFRNLLASVNEPFILIDTPGNIREEGLIDILLLSDYVVVPFNPQVAVMQSTFAFIKFYCRVFRNAMTKSNLKPAQLLFVPNMIVASWGTIAEKNAWENTIKIIQAKYGTVTSDIRLYKVLSLWDTISLFPEQLRLVQDAFGEMWSLISGDFPSAGELPDETEIDDVTPFNSDRRNV